MKPMPQLVVIRSMDLIDLRLSAELVQAIDASRERRPGCVSRNTWIAEAIEEKLAREYAASPAPKDAE